MAKYKFSQIERESIWKAHGERCFYCREPLRFNSLYIDHILPECLLAKPEKLESIIREFGLDEYEIDGLDEFRINSYYNWVPACRSCNLDKRDSIPEKSAAFHFLGRAKRKYLKIQEVEQRLKKADSLGKLISILRICLENGSINYDKISRLPLLADIPNKDRLIFMTDSFCLLIEQEKYQEAISYINKVIKDFPEDRTGFGYHSLAFCHLQLNDYQLAIDSSTKAIAANADLGLAYLVRGQACFLPCFNDFYEDTENDDFLERISRHGDDVIVFQNYNLAIKNYDNAVKILPDHPDSFYWRAICKSFLMVRFSTYFLGDEPLLLRGIMADLRKAAEIYFKGSKLSRCKETLRIYSDLLEMHKNIFASYENSKQLLAQWNSEYFALVSVPEE
jgi:tetratricopeptide (TPR) repeat protein